MFFRCGLVKKGTKIQQFYSVNGTKQFKIQITILIKNTANQIF